MLNSDKVDKIMAQIGYAVSAITQDADAREERYYIALGKEFSIMIVVRPEDEAFRFTYSDISSMSQLKTHWMAPLHSRSHFVRQYHKFVKEAEWYAKYFE